jgi:hypothetical protein
MASSKKRRDSLLFLEEQMNQLTLNMQGQPRAQVRGAGSEVEAHNGSEASRYEANQLLMSRLAHGFSDRDGPVVCVMGHKCKHASSCGLTNGHSCYIKHSWIRDLFTAPPRFISMPHGATMDSVMAANPAVVVAQEEFKLPRKVRGYISVRLKAFRFRMLFKIKE